VPPLRPARQDLARPIRPRASVSGAVARPTAAGAAVPGVGGGSAPSGPASFSGAKQTQPLVVLPPTQREGGRRKSRTNGRLGLYLVNDTNSARRTVAITGGAINRMPIFVNPAVGISSAEKTHLQSLARQAAKCFDPEVTFCQQSRADMTTAIAFLELKEPRLGVCERSWGACTLLSKAANNRAVYIAAKAAFAAAKDAGGAKDAGAAREADAARKAAAARRADATGVAPAAAPVVVPRPPQLPAPSSLPAPRAPPAGRGGTGDGRAADAGATAQSPADFFAMNP